MRILERLLGPATSTQGRDGLDEQSRYRCVQIIADRDACCERARELAGRRFLPEQIPNLPLKGCDRDSCDCSYELYTDRRSAERRA